MKTYKFHIKNTNAMENNSRVHNFRNLQNVSSCASPNTTWKGSGCICDFACPKCGMGLTSSYTKPKISFIFQILSYILRYYLTMHGESWTIYSFPLSLGYNLCIYIYDGTNGDIYIYIMKWILSVFLRWLIFTLRNWSECRYSS